MMRALTVEQEGQVVTIRMNTLKETIGHGADVDIHWELAAALEELRNDQTSRIIVLTGAYDGEFLVPPPTSHYGTPLAEKRHVDPAGVYKIFTGIVRTHQIMAEIEKPIVARVNGDVIGFGQALMFAADLIVAQEDAKVSDVHLGMGRVTTSSGEHVGAPFGLVPGDGGAALVPLFMTPTQAKEYLMLSREHTASELAEMGIINYAVPADQLDAKVDELVGELLQRSPYALAWTKRVCNRHIAAQLNMTLDAAAGYEMVSFVQASLTGYNESDSLETPKGSALPHEHQPRR